MHFTFKFCDGTGQVKPNCESYVIFHTRIKFRTMFSQAVFNMCIFVNIMYFLIKFYLQCDFYMNELV